MPPRACCHPRIHSFCNCRGPLVPHWPLSVAGLPVAPRAAGTLFCRSLVPCLVPPWLHLRGGPAGYPFHLTPLSSHFPALHFCLPAAPEPPPAPEGEAGHCRTCLLCLLKTRLPASEPYRNMVSISPLNCGSRRKLWPLHIFPCEGII